ncbi:hypothetical protein F750_4432 [Streptomyces sp. PAMC 26508]|nr:hypothetical protein F750_4432 [Streptomyces sp. PAMC 26508]
MDRALTDGDPDVVVGDDSGETLGDAVQFYGGGTAGRVDDALSLAGQERDTGGRGGGEVIAPKGCLHA